MNQQQHPPAEAVYVCAGICRVNPKTNLCAGCGRPWDIPRADGSEALQAAEENVVDEQARTS